VTIDHVDVLDAGRAAGGFTEIEIELVGAGSQDDLTVLGKRLRAEGARRSNGTAKVLRVLALPPPRKPGPGLRDQLQHLLAAQLRELEAHDPGVRLGDDPEDLHKFRVATRRTRAFLRATPLASELKWLAGLLGPVRDLDVLIERLGAEAASLGEDRQAGEELVGALAVQRERVRAALLEALESPRYAELLALFETSIASLAAPDDADAGPIARAAFRKLRKAAGQLPADPADDELHALRKQAKRARYAAELAALGAGRRAARAADAAKRVQDVIGEHQDAVVAEERLRALADGRTAVAAGRLIEREAARRRAARAGYPAAVERALAVGEKAFGR
jgi:CHAD domain-containing protein